MTLTASPKKVTPRLPRVLVVAAVVGTGIAAAAGGLLILALSVSITEFSPEVTVLGIGTSSPSLLTKGVEDPNQYTDPNERSITDPNEIVLRR